MTVWRQRLAPLSIVTLVLLMSNIIYYFLVYTTVMGNNKNRFEKEFSTRLMFEKDTPTMTSSHTTSDAVNGKAHVVTMSVSFSEEMTTKPTFTSSLSWNERPSCEVKTDWNRLTQFPTITTNISHWNFTDEVTCDYRMDLNHSESFTKFSFVCSDNFTEVKTFYKNFYRRRTNMDIQVVNFGDECLRRFVENCCYDALRVPNVVHYVCFNKEELQFFEFVSFISVIRFIKPCAILIHGNLLPTGSYWNYIRAIFPNIIHVKRDPPNVINGQVRKYIAHSSDIMRIEALIEYGGIYLDIDTLFVKPIDELRSFPCTMSAQTAGVMSSAFISSERNSTFVNRWLDGYKNHYRPQHYTYNAMVYPQKLAAEFPSEINVLHGNLSRPWYQGGRVVYETNYRWESIYGIHLYSRPFESQMDEELVKTFNTTVGSICRHVLFGNKELCSR